MWATRNTRDREAIERGAVIKPAGRRAVRELSPSVSRGTLLWYPVVVAAASGCSGVGVDGDDDDNNNNGDNDGIVPIVLSRRDETCRWKRKIVHSHRNETIVGKDKNGKTVGEPRDQEREKKREREKERAATSYVRGYAP